MPWNDLVYLGVFRRVLLLVLEEIYVRGVKLIDNHIWVGNVWEIIPKDHQRVLEEGSKISLQAVPGRPCTRSSQRQIVAATPRQRVPSWGNYPCVKNGSLPSHCFHRQRPVMARRGGDAPSKISRRTTCSPAQVCCQVKGFTQLLN